MAAASWSGNTRGQAPDGDQVDLVEFIEIVGGLIAYHRIYWGWKGCTLIAPVLSRRGSSVTMSQLIDRPSPVPSPVGLVVKNG